MLDLRVRKAISPFHMREATAAFRSLFSIEKIIGNRRQIASSLNSINSPPQFPRAINAGVKIHGRNMAPAAKPQAKRQAFRQRR